MGVATIALVAAAGVAATGSVLGGIAARKEAGFQVKQAEEQAQQAADEAAFAEVERREQLRRQISAQNAAAAAAGITTGGSGSLQAINDEATRLGERDINNIRSIGSSNVRSFLLAGKQARKAGQFGFISGLLGGGASIGTGAATLSSSGALSSQSTVNDGAGANGLPGSI